MNIYNKYVLEYDLENGQFAQFTKFCTQEEFGNSQSGFFYAVKAFPQMLCRLASMIESPEARLKVVENIWEEHGHGNKSEFHTETFKSYLSVLGQESIPRNFFVDQWVEKVLKLDMSASSYAAYLGGIEFIYTRISKMICDTLERFGLNGSQHHYKTHKELDFQHATELLEVALELENQDNYPSFCQGVDDLVELFNQMTFLTQKEVDVISEEKVAFYYSREDSQVELNYLKENSHVLTVCSGGEHLLAIKEKYPSAHITALDINPQQIRLAQSKFINRTKELEVGKFEKIFHYFSSKMTTEDIIGIKFGNKFALKKLELLCQDIFSNKNLNIIFTEEATKYSSQNFSHHFYQVFKQKIMVLDNQPSNMNNILGKTLPVVFNGVINSDNVDYYQGDFISYFNGLSSDNSSIGYDLISLSNIGDWMPVEKLVEIVTLAHKYTKPQGCVITRKLLGDYSLKNIMTPIFSRVLKEEDNTGFYTECWVGIK